MMHRIAWLAVICCVCVGVSCSQFQTKEAAYLNSVRGQATQTDIRNQLGAPKLVRHTHDGQAQWIYETYAPQLGNQRTNPGTWCEQYQLTFDNNDILQRWTHNTHFHPGDDQPKVCLPES